MAQNWTSRAVGKKALKGAVALGVRQLLVQGANVLGGIFLARLLPPSEFGLFSIVTFIMGFLMVFGDVGLGASLIRQEEEPTITDYRVVFTAQQALVMTAVGVLWFLAPWIADAYRLSSNGAGVFRLVALSLLFTSFQVIPSIQMERQLAFDRLAVVEVSQAVVYNVVTLVLALNGFKELSFAFGLLFRSLVGGLLANVLNPWPLGWSWNVRQAFRHLRFGLPYQGAAVANVVKDTFQPVFVGLLVGSWAVGYVNWATMVANYPILAVLLLGRLYLPMFSRIRHDAKALGQAVHLCLTFLTSGVYTSSLLLFVFRYPLTHLVFGTKWDSALVLFLPFTLINLLLAPTIIVNGALNALGESKAVFYLAITWMISTWILGPVLVVHMGWAGWGWANLGVNVLNIIVWHKLSKLIGVNWRTALEKPIGIAAIGGISGLALEAIGLPWWGALIGAVVLSTVTGIWFLAPELNRVRRLWVA